MSFIAIDLGTSFIKGAVLDLEESALKHVRRVPFPAQVDEGGPLCCEFDPGAIVAATRKLIDGLAPEAPDLEGVVMCTQMHGMVLVDGHGVTRSNCLTWRDQRATMPHPSGSGTYFEVLSRKVTPQQARQLGNELNPCRPLCFLFWFAEQGELEAGLMPVSMPDYVLSALCGGPPGVELTNAGAYGALNLETLNWHEEVINALGLGGLRWPEVRKQGEVAGYLNVGGRRVPCYAPVGDYQCALVGALFGVEEVSLNIATGCQVSTMTEELVLGEYQTRPFFDGRFLHTFTDAPGGRALNVLVDLLCGLARAEGLKLNDPWKMIAQAVEGIAGTDLEIDLNFFSTLGGAITNITGSNLTVGHLFHAAFKNMADNYYDCARRLWPEKTWRRLVFSGGVACKLGKLREAIQRRFRVCFRITPCEEDTLFGLLMLASVFSGRAKSVAELTCQLRGRLLSA